MFFECHDSKMKSFTGFIADIIPGQIIREEIFGIAQNSEFTIYRIHYYTKYYKIDDLRDRLLNPNKYKKDEYKQDNQEEEEDEEEEEEEEDEEGEDDRRIIDEEECAQKFDISEKNENDFIYSLYKKNQNIFILEDKEKKIEITSRNFPPDIFFLIVEVIIKKISQ